MLKKITQLLVVSLLMFSAASPLLAGVDGDGVPDNIDLDNDNDGILDTVEGACPIPSTTLNSEPYPLNTSLESTPGFPLSF